MNKYELSLVNDRLFACMSQIKNFLDSTDVIKLASIRKNLITKVLAVKCLHHQSQSFLVCTNLINQIECVTFVAACLQSYGKKVLQNDLIQENYFAEIISFLHNCSNVKVLLEKNRVSLQSIDRVLPIVQFEEIDSPSSNILCRSITLLLSVCGKNVTNNIDCFELNEYGISNTLNGIKIADITRGNYEKHEDARDIF